jgi:hypothetical protein
LLRLLQGVLFPSYHKAYWIGLQASNWPLFSWIDPGTPGLNTPTGFKNWGYLNGAVRAWGSRGSRAEPAHP